MTTTEPTPPDELAERWRIAFERCAAATCCGVNTKHQPGCPRRREHLDRQLRRARERAEMYHVEAQWHSEIGGRRGMLQVAGAIAAIVTLALALSAWLVYGL